MVETLVLWIGVAGLLVAADLFTKHFAKTHFADPIQVIPGIFQLFLSFNTGIAFSIPIPNAVMLILAPLLISVMAIVIFKFCDTSETVAKLILVLLIAGGAGNLIDRIFTGAVVDFLSFSFWPSFNLADSYLTIAAFLLILFYGRITVYGGRK